MWLGNATRKRDFNHLFATHLPVIDNSYDWRASMSKIVDINGEKFGRLTVVNLHSQDIKDHRARWKCLCECGNTTLVYGSNLRSGGVKSCGCLRVDNLKTHGLCGSSEHIVWCNMLQRCSDVNGKSYDRYGGRGIGVCDRWLSFELFFSDMGNRPSNKYTIERIDNNVGYEPSNCKWATREENNRNTSRSKIWSVYGDMYCSAQQAATVFGVAPQTIAKWCDGYTRNGKRIEPKDGCYSKLKYIRNKAIR